VGHSIAHQVDVGPGNVGVLRRVIGMMTFDVSGGFAQDLDIADHRVLLFLAGEKSRFVQVCRVAFDPLNGLQDMMEILRQPLRVGFAHTGTASRNTRSRQLIGSALGVNTSTGTPNRAWSWF
jgi:hypothetical protein